jgi:ATP-binding cassette subfamily B multidrug efflux pump
LRLFAQLSWYFRREWRRYLGAIALLAIIAVLQLIPPKVVGIVVDGVTQQHYTAEKVWMWIGALVLIAVMVYLLRYVWRVLLSAPLISWPSSCGKIFTASSAASIRPFTCATAPAI